jgi:hypothetical protein
MASRNVSSTLTGTVGSVLLCSFVSLRDKVILGTFGNYHGLLHRLHSNVTLNKLYTGDKLRVFFHILNSRSIFLTLVITEPFYS